ncbi:MAG: hypothetical protein M5R36_12400 [Deltaproteobacteria bacterium]|nr:hypothetical protein [Deltaproteobacteria bacterium]
MRRDRINVFRLLALLALAAISGASVLACSCGDDDDDSGAPDDDTSPDDDTTPDHGADDDTVPGDDDDDTAPDDDAGDDDTGEPFEGIVPTTLDVTIVPVEDGDTWVLGDGPGDPHVERNDLGAAPTRDPDGADPLSAAYFLSIADPQLVDEESPTRLTFLDDWWVLFGAFESVFRPQEDLTPHQFNAMIRTANRLQSDYGRDFDLALVLGDGTDNAQFNELQLMIDLLDGTGVLAGDEGWARPDSGFPRPQSRHRTQPRRAEFRLAGNRRRRPQHQSFQPPGPAQLQRGLPRPRIASLG